MLESRGGTRGFKRRHVAVGPIVAGSWSVEHSRVSAGWWWSMARRLVRIKDRRLGFLQFSFLAAIVGYIVGYALIWQQGYNTRVPASGVTQLAVRFALCGRRESRVVSSVRWLFGGWLTLAIARAPEVHRAPIYA